MTLLATGTVLFVRIRSAGGGFCFRVPGNGAEDAFGHGRGLGGGAFCIDGGAGVLGVGAGRLSVNGPVDQVARHAEIAIGRQGVGAFDEFDDSSGELGEFAALLDARSGLHFAGDSGVPASG